MSPSDRGEPENPDVPAGQFFIPGESEEVGDHLQLSLGQLHNLVLSEYHKLQTQAQRDNPTVEAMKSNLVTAVGTVVAIPSGFDSDQVIDDALEFYCVEFGVRGDYDLSLIVDTGQRTWLDGLFTAVAPCTSSSDVQVAVIQYGKETGFPAFEPLTSVLDVILHSGEYWDGTMKKRGSVIILADGLGAARGILQGACMSGNPIAAGLVGLFYTVTYSIAAEEALPPDG